MDPAVVKSHGLSETEFQRILDVLGREPSIVELGIFSVMWSEHCSYKSSRKFLKNLPTRAPHVLQGPGENAGIVDIGDGLAIAFKMESHNHPSYIEPYQGAATGVGGILRDVFTMGARPIANLNSLRFGSADHPKTPHLLRGVVAGIGDYGNCVGVPTVAGETSFDPSFNGNILVNAMTVGLVKHDEIFRGYATGVGNPVIYFGSKTGRDGIHGATMASDVFDEASADKRPTVQVGDPFTEKLLLEACLEVMKTGAVIGIQDMGAAGLTSSSFEMASRAGTGIYMDLSRVPCRELAMTAYDIMLSESQERMLMVVQKGREKEVLAVFEKWELDSAVVGEVTNDGRMRIVHHGERVADLPIAPLVEAAPVYDRPRERPSNLDQKTAIPLPTISDWNAVLTQLMTSPNLCSRRWIYSQYDQSVGANTIPGGEAGLVRITGTEKAVAVSVDCNSRYCFLDPKLGAMHAIAECSRNISCTGARPLGATDCLNFGNPERPEIMWQFEQATLGLAEACTALEIPIVSGNVSLYNESQEGAIYPTPGIGMVGVLDDMAKHVTAHFKDAGDAIFLLGELSGELGGSEVAWVLSQTAVGKPPALDLQREKAVQQLCRDAISKELIKSAHDVSDGGLAVALAESCFSQGVGAQIDAVALDPATFLFGEAPSRIIVTVQSQNVAALTALAKANVVPLHHLGTVCGKRLQIENWIDVDVAELRGDWARTLPRIAEGV